MRNRGLFFILYFFAFIFLLQNSSCKKQDTIDNANLTFSRSIVSFDTVFTTIGSVTEKFTVVNPHNFDITTDIYLAGSSYSSFNINVDGLSGNSFKNVVIPAKDSIFIFVKVTINPNNTTLPFIVEDSIMFHTGTRKQQVNLVAYGQNANFIVATDASGLKVIAGEHETVTWTKEKPYVIYGWAAVDSLGKLIIEPGTEIYLHSESGLWIYRHGNIEINGTLEEPVTFQSDRRDSHVVNNGKLWDRIWINESNHDNIINYAVVKDSYIGIQVSALEEFLPGKTVIKNTVIKNNAKWGFLGWVANVDMINCEISNSHEKAVECAIGNYALKHVTIANNSSGSRNATSLWISNGYANGNITTIGNTNFTAQNCIITGNMNNELGSKVYDGANFTHQFNNCIIKSEENNLQNFDQCLFNKEIKFENWLKSDFRLKEESPAINAGRDIGVDEDLLGNSRDAQPDVGAYEYAPGKGKFVKR